MRGLRSIRLAALLVVFAAAAISAGAPADTDTPQLKVRPEELLRRFSAAADEAYTLGEGDELTIEALGRPELTGKHIVGPDGQITIPAAGTLTVGGKTREEAAKIVSDAWTPYYRGIKATIRVDKYGSNRVLILGRVLNPGIMAFDRTPTLLEAVTRAGFPPPANPPGRQVGAAEATPRRVAVFRGKDEAVWIDLRRLLLSGSAIVDVRLRRNDIVYVPGDQDEFISVLGEVQAPGAFALTPDVTLTRLVAMAGGFTEKAAKGHIQVISSATGLTRTFSEKEILNPERTPDITLHKDDIIYVPTSSLARSAYVLQQLSPLSGFLFFSAALKR